MKMQKSKITNQKSWDCGAEKPSRRDRRLQKKKCLSESPHVIIRNNISYFFSIFIVLFPFEKYGYKICQVTQAQLEISLTRGSMRIRSRYKSPKHNLA